MSKVTIYSTAGENAKVVEIPSTVTTFGALKTLIGAIYPWNTASVLDENETEYTSTSQVIPTSDFCLFVYPKETKSGQVASKLPYTAAKRKAIELGLITANDVKSALEINAAITAHEAKLAEKAAKQAENDNEVELIEIINFLKVKYHFVFKGTGYAVNSQSVVDAINAHFHMPDVCQSKYYEVKKKLNL